MQETTSYLRTILTLFDGQLSGVTSCVFVDRVGIGISPEHPQARGEVASQGMSNETCRIIEESCRTERDTARIDGSHNLPSRVTEVKE
jgi:hypothetical protein